MSAPWGYVLTAIFAFLLGVLFGAIFFADDANAAAAWAVAGLLH